MIKIGVTGGIGNGKTTIVTLMEIMGIPVYVADLESKRLTNTSPLIREKLTAMFGSSVYSEDGLNKKLLARLIFNDLETRKKVNDIIHPVVQTHFISWTKKVKTKYCAIESAILFESGFDPLVDVRLMVFTPLEIKIQRIAQRDGLPREEIMRRIRSQLPDEIKSALCDAVIVNDDQQAIIPQMVDFLFSLSQK